VPETLARALHAEGDTEENRGDTTERPTSDLTSGLDHLNWTARGPRGRGLSGVSDLSNF